MSLDQKYELRICIVVCFVFLSSQMSFSSGSCAGSSVVDQTPFFVGQTYFDVLERSPEPAGQDSWVSQIQDLNARVCRSRNPSRSSGNCEWNNNAQVALQFLSSPESVSKNGALTSNDAFVKALYKLFLRREPDSEGLANNLRTLQSGGNRVGVLANLISSPEYRRRFTCTSDGNPTPRCHGASAVDPVASFVAQTGKDVLGDFSDGASLASWTKYITSRQEGMCRNPSGTALSVCDRAIEAQMVTELLGSSAYQKSNLPVTDNSAFVTALYSHLLRRAPDPGGLQSNVAKLDQIYRAGLAYSFLTNDEYRRRFACYAGDHDYDNLGINGHPLTQPAYSDSDGVSFDDQLTQVHNSGAQWYRFDVTAPTVGADFTKMDALVARAQAHGVKLLPVLFAAIDRAHDSPSTIYTKSRDGVLNFVSRYKGSIHVWELSNEQDAYSGSGDGDKPSDYDSQKYAIVAAMLKGMSDGVRAADSSALRIIDISGWLHTGYLQRLENDRIPYDIVGIHWYQGMGEITCPGQSFPCPSNPLHFNVIQRAEEVTNGKPLWMTETNYSPLASNSISMNISRKEQYLTDVLKRYDVAPAAYPFQTVMVYELLDEPNFRNDVTQSQMGLFSVTALGGPKYALGPAKPEFQLLRSLSATK